MPHGVHQSIEVCHKEDDENGDSYSERPSFMKEFEEVDSGVLQGHDVKLLILSWELIATREEMPQQKCQTGLLWSGQANSVQDCCLKREADSTRKRPCDELQEREIILRTENLFVLEKPETTILRRDEN